MIEKPTLERLDERSRSHARELERIGDDYVTKAEFRQLSRIMWIGLGAVITSVVSVGTTLLFIGKVP